jgi:hypothetical protein
MIQLERKLNELKVRLEMGTKRLKEKARMRALIQ